MEIDNNYCLLSFKSINSVDTILFSIKLISHFTTVYGIDSGEGKSWLFDMLIRMRAANELQITCIGTEGESYDVVFASLDTFKELLEQEARKVIIVDEIFINKSSELLKLVNSCSHFLVVITRSFPMAANSPLNGIYTVHVGSTGKFHVELINKQGLIPLTTSLKDADIIVTEASSGRSENQLLQFLIKKFNKNILLIAADGKDKIQAKLLWCTKKYPEKRIVVFTDLYNISAQLKLLVKRCKQNPNIVFYNYGCFEELLCESSFIAQVKKCFNKKSFDYITLERFFEEKVNFLTKGTIIEYNHHKPIMSECYLQECVLCANLCEFYAENKLQDLLDSYVGIPIYEYFCKRKETF